MKKINHNHKW